MKIDKETSLIIKNGIVTKIGYPEGCADSIIRLAKVNNYLQILYTYNLEALNFLMQFALENEDYESCHQISETVRLQNQATGSNMRLLEEKK